MTGRFGVTCLHLVLVSSALTVHFTLSSFLVVARRHYRYTHRFPSPPLQPLISTFFCGRSFSVCIRNPCFAPFALGEGSLFLETIASEVSKFLTVKTLHSPHVPPFSLPPDISLSRSEGWFGCLVPFRAVIIICFCTIGSSSVGRGVHSIWIVPSV